MLINSIGHHSGGVSYTALAFMPFARILLFAFRKKLRINPKLMLILIGTVGAATLVGCGYYTNTTTPAGTSAITITATSGATSHTSTVNLTVQ